MRTTGICRKIDELGRIVVPSEYRNALDLSGGDDLEISMEGNRIILQRPQNGCFLCGSTEDLTKVKEKFICGECLNLIKKS
jgi:transcriptional pleiotropic regulator of transition state genes